MPPLALKTALMTEMSMLGNASFRISSVFCVSVEGLGGFGGAASAAVVDDAMLDEAAVLGLVVVEFWLGASPLSTPVS